MQDHRAWVCAASSQYFSRRTSSIISDCCCWWSEARTAVSVAWRLVAQGSQIGHSLHHEGLGHMWPACWGLPAEPHSAWLCWASQVVALDVGIDGVAADALYIDGLGIDGVAADAAFLSWALRWVVWFHLCKKILFPVFFPFSLWCQHIPLQNWCTALVSRWWRHGWYIHTLWIYIYIYASTCLFVCLFWATQFSQVCKPVNSPRESNNNI